MKNYSLQHAGYESEAVEMTVLPNGLRVVTAKRPIHTVTISTFTNVGSRNESEAENGLSHFLEHMAFKGTTTRTAKDISLQVERLGADINAFTSHNVTAYYVVGLPDHISTALDILSDVLTNSTLATDEIEREKNVVCEEIYESNDDIRDIAMNTLSKTAYPDQPLGRAILGPESNVRGFDHAVLASYMGRHYNSANMIVMAVGNVDHDTFVAQATERFGGMVPGQVSTVETATYVGGTAVVKDERFDQAHLFVAFPAPGGRTDEYARYDLLSDVLGSGMSSPLFQEVREKRGLCYSVYAGTMAQNDHSLFIIQGSAASKNVEAFLTTACKELARIASGVITDEDFERARNQIVRQIVSRSENSMRTASSTAGDLFALGRVRTMDETVSVYMAVTREELIETARTMLTTVPTIVVAGNAAEADYSKLVAEALTV